MPQARAASAATVAASASTPRPNILLILVDDMGYGDFGRFNGGLCPTPRLDALMDEGVVLSQHFTASPVCNPSRACLLTGRYPHRTGSIDTLEWWGLERLALREQTLADLLRQAGYRTGLIGKWHLGSFDPRYHPRQRGFDETICFRGGMHDYYRWRLEWGDTLRRGDGQTYLTDVWTQQAVDFIRRARPGQPFFLHLTYNAPHTPLQCPAEDAAAFAHLDLPQGVKTLYGMIRRMERGVEQVLETLDQQGLRDNTLVIFTSDNGPQFGGEGDRCTTRFNCQLHGAKGSTYDGGIRVPGIWRWPAGGLIGGRTVDAMVHFADYLPTLLHAAGVTQRPHRPLDGIDLLPLLQGDPAAAHSDCTRRFWQWNRYAPLAHCNAAMRDGDWKLVRPALPEAMKVHDIELLHKSMYEPEHFETHGILTGPYPSRTVPPPPPAELYNLATDPLEQHNLAPTEPARVHHMSQALDQWFEEVEADRATITDAAQLPPT